jgi:hypothetical protein
VKDPLQEFEELNKGVDKIFENIFQKLTSALHTKMPSGLSVKPIQTHSGLPSKQYVYQGSQLGQKVSDRIAKYREEERVKAQCVALGSDGPNDLYELGKNGISATFGKAKNKVRDTRGLAISPEELMCYDLQKDKLGIAWLFDDNARFEAKRIWGGPKKVYFQGIWNAGDFKGIMTSNSKLVGGTIVPPGKIQYSGQKKATQQTASTTPTTATTLSIGIHKLPVPNLKFTMPDESGRALNIKAINIKIDDADELAKFTEIQNDFSRNVFSSKLSAFKKLVQNGIIDGYGAFPVLQYLFGQNLGKNYQNLTEKQKGLMEYFSDLKLTVIDNMLHPETSSKFIEWLKGQIFGISPEVKKRPESPSPQELGKKLKLQELISKCLSA